MSSTNGAATRVIYVGTGNLVLLEGVFDREEPRILRYAARKDPEGFENGFVTNLEKASLSLLSLVEAFVPKAKTAEISVSVVLANAKLRNFDFSSSQYYQGMPRTLSTHEVRSVVSQTRSVATLPLSEFVLQAVPESFLVNDMSGVRNPLGLEAHRLGVRLKIFTLNFEDFKNISKAFEAADIVVENYFPGTLTLSEAVLHDEEKEQGVVLVHLQEDYLELILWKNNSLIESKILPWGGNALTAQMASRWGIDRRDAEKVKRRYGALSLDSKFGGELIPLVERLGKGNASIQRSEFQQAFLDQARRWLESILQEVDDFIQKKNVRHPHLVFSGDDTAFDGFLEFLQSQFSRDARLGLARKVEAPHELLVQPSFTPALGMFRWFSVHEQGYRRLLTPNSLLHKTLASAKDWFSAYF